MKRELKFRAYSEQDAIMYQPLSLQVIAQLGHDFSDNIKLMQYTGLKDKNDVEIYEQMEIDDNFEVSFDNGSYILTNISNGDIILLYNYLKEKNGQIKITKEYTEV